MPGKRQEYRPPENPSLVRTPCRPWTKWFSRGKSTDKLPHQPPMARQPQAPPPSHSASRSAPIITHLDVPRRPPRHDEMYDHFLPSSIAHPPPPPPPKRAAPAPPPPKRAPPPPPKPEAPLSPPPAPLVQTPFQITAPAPLVQTPFQITAPAPPLPKEIAPLTPVKPPSVPRSASNASLLSARTASLSHPLRQYQSHDASDCEDDSTATVSTCSTIPEPMRKFVNSDWTALAGFVSTRDDEADVMPGDTVRVEWVWSDGWAWVALFFIRYCCTGAFNKWTCIRAKSWQSQNTWKQRIKSGWAERAHSRCPCLPSTRRQEPSFRVHQRRPVPPTRRRRPWWSFLRFTEHPPCSQRTLITRIWPRPSTLRSVRSRPRHPRHPPCFSPSHGKTCFGNSWIQFPIPRLPTKKITC
ncbi:hypothetical protein BC828DRAFT_386793 [Blastocladiella britannica]|nr:hypothetical protein BC828DRAFT_386793 [Blastocladiella britannica]